MLKNHHYFMKVIKLEHKNRKIQNSGLMKKKRIERFKTKETVLFHIENIEDFVIKTQHSTILENSNSSEISTFIILIFQQM